jgi:ureidoglycolate dehydrogenase (NAD+)
MKEGYVTVSATELKSLCISAFRRVGVPRRDGELASDTLVDANLRGIDSHGVMRLGKYIQGLRTGSINARPRIRVTRSARAIVRVDGDNGLGAVVACRAIRELIRTCKVTGIAAVGVSSSNHYGAVSHYLLKATAEGLIAMGFVHGESLQVPLGGMDAFFGTNPIAFTFPTRKSTPVVVDFATSATTFGKIMQAKASQNLLPEGTVLDHQGRSTRNPERAARILPAAGHKGYGLALAVEILSGILNGCPYGPHVPPVFRDDADVPGRLGHFFAAIDPERFCGLESFLENIENMIRELHQVNPIAGVDAVLVPGEPENRTYEERVRSGIPLKADLWEKIQQLAAGAS